MIVGIGCDLCDISRMAGLLKDTVFLKRYFAIEEQVYILSRGAFAAASMAGCFAVKEAFVKALGIGFEGIQPKDVVILHRENGAPYLLPRESAKKALDIIGAVTIHVSISHDNNYAIAFVVMEAN